MYNYETFSSSEKALEQIPNCSICIITEEGIRNIKNYGDVLGSNLVYVANIPPYGEDYNKHIIRMGEMVNYIPINKENIQIDDIEKRKVRRIDSMISISKLEQNSGLPGSKHEYYE